MRRTRFSGPTATRAHSFPIALSIPFIVVGKNFHLVTITSAYGKQYANLAFTHTVRLKDGKEIPIPGKAKKAT